MQRITWIRQVCAAPRACRAHAFRSFGCLRARTSCSVLVVCALFAGSAPAAAQAVRGELRWAERAGPLPGARLLLLRESGARVDSAVTDRDGRFRMSAPEAGTYYLHFQSDGWASVTSNPLQLQRDVTTDFEFTVPLVAVAALHEMSDVIRMNERLQSSLPEICGEALRPEEAGLLVGVVRERRTRQPVGGVRVSVATSAHGVTRSTLSMATGVYVLCNVPHGASVTVTAEATDGRTDSADVVIRAGTISWYDLNLRARRH